MKPQSRVHATLRHALLALLVMSPTADARDVKVVDASGDVVFIDAGSADGLRAGAKVMFGGVESVVIETNAHTASVRAVVPIGTAGVIDVVAAKDPRPASTFVAQWPDPDPPARHQSVKAIATPQKIDIALIGTAYAVGKGDSASEARIVASFDNLTELPLGADLDASARWYSTGANKQAHTPLMVRALQVRYGAADDPTLMVGRLRYAATSLGMLDGGRAAVHLGNLELAAFGGLVPDPVSGKPTSDASRFGVEAILSRPGFRGSATIYGSTWQGAIDERRLALNADSWYHRFHASSWLELQQFSDDNPWLSSGVHITGVGTSVTWRDRNYYASADLSYLTPELSLRLAAALPVQWLTNGATEGTGTLGAGAAWGPWTVDALGVLGDMKLDLLDGRQWLATGWLRGARAFGDWRIYVAPSVGLVDEYSYQSVDVGVGYAPTRTLDVALGYRPEREVFSTGDRLVHQGTADLRYVASRHLAIALTALGSSDALAALATVVFRP